MVHARTHNKIEIGAPKREMSYTFVNNGADSHLCRRSLHGHKFVFA
jgi:hypothetical protein